MGISLPPLAAGRARTMEPRAPTPPKRVEGMRALSGAGVPGAVLAAPMAPTLNDHELESILQASAEAGASVATYILLRLPRELQGLFSEWLETHAPHKAKRVMSLLSQSRDGRHNDSQFGTRMTGTGVHAKLLGQRFRLACKKLGLAQADPGEFRLNVDAFTRPARVGDQLTFL